MGIHSGPVSRVTDVNDRSNAAGAGINIAQRVMSCGDAGHILLSKRAAEDLIEYPRWRPYLHEIGECAFKHGTKITLVNFYDDQVGNAELPIRFQEYNRESRRGLVGPFGPAARRTTRGHLERASTARQASRGRRIGTG